MHTALTPEVDYDPYDEEELKIQEWRADQLRRLGVPRLLATEFAGGVEDRIFAAGMIEGVDDSQEIHGHIDGARDARDLRRFHPAARIHAISDDEHSPVTVFAFRH